jgi:hypothetical protein
MYKRESEERETEGERGRERERGRVEKRAVLHQDCLSRWES